VGKEKERKKEKKKKEKKREEKWARTRKEKKEGYDIQMSK